nr:MAG: replication associated protein [Cressdnaviricota sp.]
MQARSKSRGWCFTINNYTTEDVHAVEKLTDYCKYWIYGREVGQDRSTPHLQGFLYFTNACGLARVKQLLPRAHLESQRGTCNQAIEYCKKDGDWVDWGDKPDHGGGSTQRERWRELITLSERGELDTIRDKYPGEFFRYNERIRSLRVRQAVPLDGELEHEWWYGSTGTGKSRKLWDMYPDHYAKELNKWWDGYCDEGVVAIEEWAPKNECTASFLKVWADRYPFPAQIKGGSLKKIRPTKIIVLSNYTIDQCFERQEDREPIKRRFKVVHFPAMFIPQFVLRTEEEEKEDIAFSQEYINNINGLWT